MLTTSNHLTVRRSSPTTVEYIVSNASHTNTVTTHLLQYLAVLVRISVGLLTVATLNAKIQYQPEIPDTPSSEPNRLFRFDSKLPIFEALAKSIAWQALIPISITVLFLCFRRFYTGKNSTHLFTVFRLFLYLSI